MTRCAVLALAALALNACRSAPHAPPERPSFRTDIIYPPPRITAGTPSQPLDDHIRTAARAGMDWLMQDRKGDGSWDSSYPDAISALALSAALRDPRMEDAAFRRYWEATVAHLLAQESTDGAFSGARPTEQPYEHALIARALCDALPFYAATMPALRDAAQRATRYILDRQQPLGGWHYGYAQGRTSSTSLTVVQMDALFAAAQQDIVLTEVEHALHGAARNLVSAQHSQSGRYGYIVPRVGQAVINGYALYGLQLAGWGLSLSARHGWLDADRSIDIWPESLRRPLFAAHYNHLARFHHGGAPWTRWKDHFYGELLAGQDVDGHWLAPAFETELGPAYATALAVLMIHATDEQARLPSAYPHPIPGPLYRAHRGNESVFLLASSMLGQSDGFLLDTALTDLLQATDRVVIEGSPRVWAHQIQTRITDLLPYDAPTPLSSEVRAELNRLFGVPATHGHIWNEAPPWTVALMIWGKLLDQESRQVDQLTEQQVALRMPPGRRIEGIPAPTDYADAFSRLTHDQGVLLLQHALSTRTALPQLLDELANAWCAGDEAGLANSVANLIGPDPGVRAVLDQLFAPARAHLYEAVLSQLAAGGRTLIVVPAWHLYGPEGVRARLATRGVTLERLPEL